MFTVEKNIQLTKEWCDQIAAVYISCGRGTRYLWKEIEKSFENTDYYLIAFDEQKRAVGVLKAFTDDVYSTWLAELMVAKPFRNRGIGTALLRKFSKDFEHTTIYGTPLADAAPFYAPFGIKKKEEMAVCSRPLVHDEVE